MTEQAFRPFISKREMRAAWWVAGAAILLLLGVLVGAATAPEPSGPPAECVAALDAADALVDSAADNFGLIAQALDALSSLDLDRVEDLANQLDPGEVRQLRDEYDDRAKECRDG